MKCFRCISSVSRLCLCFIKNDIMDIMYDIMFSAELNFNLPLTGVDGESRTRT